MGNNPQAVYVRTINIYGRVCDRPLESTYFLEIEDGRTNGLMANADLRLEFVLDQEGQVWVRDCWNSGTDLTATMRLPGFHDAKFALVKPGMRIHLVNEFSEGTIVCWLRGDALFPVWYSKDQTVPDEDPDKPKLWQFTIAPRRRRVPKDDTTRNGKGNPQFNVLGQIFTPSERGETCVVVDAQGARRGIDPKATYVLFFGMDSRGWPYVRTASKERPSLEGEEMNQSAQTRVYLDTNGEDEFSFSLYPEQSLRVIARVDGVNPLYSVRWRRDT